MQFYISGRQAGKTELLVDWFLENPEAHVVATATNAMRSHFIRRVQDRMKMKLPMYLEHNIITAGQAGRIQGAPRPVGVDDLDHILARMFGNVHIVTATGTKIRPDSEVERG